MPTPDYAHRLTDKELALLEKRIAKLYLEAWDDLCGTGHRQIYRRRTAHAMDLPGRRRQLALDGGKSSTAFSQTSGGRPCANLQEHHRG